MWWLLVGCAGVDGEESALEVDVAPRFFSVTWDNSEKMDCRELVEENRTIYEWIGSTYVVNLGDHPVTVEAFPTHTRDDVNMYEDTKTWMDVSVPADFSADVQPDDETIVEVYAMGRCSGTERVYDPFADYIYEVEILVDGQAFVVESQIVLTPDNSDYK